MDQETPICVLRTLIICDGHEVTELSPRTHQVGCYCLALAAYQRHGASEQAGEQRRRRALAVSHATETMRRLAQRARWIA